jgi:hypothetical protein
MTATIDSTGPADTRAAGEPADLMLSAFTAHGGPS